MALVDAISFKDLVRQVAHHKYPQSSTRILLGADLYLAGTDNAGEPLSFADMVSVIKTETGDTTLNRGHLQNLLLSNRIISFVTNDLVARRFKQKNVRPGSKRAAQRAAAATPV